ncbi:MAG: hypothetical protein ACI8YQ_002756 [Polaribacter sp.]|jgi:hypothetical protein
MEDDILDHFDEDNSSDNNIIAIKYFYFESQARLYSAKLETEGIPSFVSNSNAITAVPLGSPGIGLHIRQGDYEMAKPIIIRMDQRAEMELADDNESFRDADHDDINYQKKLNEHQKGTISKAVQYIVAVIIVFVIIRMIWRSLNPEGLWDFF